MDGEKFYEFLKKTYTKNGQPIYGNFTFRDWLYIKKDDTFSFRFNIINNNPKSIRKDIIVAAWNSEITVNDNWLEKNFSLSFHNDCRLHILKFLINKHRGIKTSP